MPLPGVNVNESDNKLGVIAAAGGKLLAIVGPAADGPFNTPATYSRGTDVAATFKSGPLVEAAAYCIEQYGLQVVLVRSAATNPPAVSVVQSVATGTAVISVEEDEPTDDAKIALEFLTGGTIGQAGITYRVSYDGGKNWSARMNLGTDDEIEFPDAGDLGVAFAAGTVVAGDLHTFTATGPTWSGADLQAALAPLGITQLQWEIVLLVGGAIDADNFDTADAVRNFRNGKHTWISAPRIPNAGETEAAYRTALEPLRAAKASKHTSLYAGAVRLTSSVNGRVQRRPLAWAAGARQAAVSEEVNIALDALGPLPGVSIRDANGAPIEHDEAVFPGLDDLGFGTATSIPRKQGTYITLPRTFAPTGSDFEIFPNRRVMNLVHEVLEDYLRTVLHRPILVSRKTGRILSTEAIAITAEADARLAAAVLSKPKASGAFFVLSRTDNLLSLPKLTCGAKVLPLAYPRWIDLDLSFENPALQIQAV